MCAVCHLASQPLSVFLSPSFCFLLGTQKHLRPRDDPFPSACQPPSVGVARRLAGSAELSSERRQSTASSAHSVRRYYTPLPTGRTSARRSHTAQRADKSTTKQNKVVAASSHYPIKERSNNKRERARHGKKEKIETGITSEYDPKPNHTTQNGKISSILSFRSFPTSVAPV